MSETNRKPYCDEGKVAAPRWLVYPNLDPYTIGWRMGYGEDYAMNEPPRDREFFKLFPKPRNWLFSPRKSSFKRFPLLGYLWREDGKPEYSEITDDCIKVNDFITPESDGKFGYNSFHFSSIEHGFLAAKYSLFGKCDPRETELEELRKGFDLTSDELEYWDNFRHSVCLNAAYYKFMQDEELKRWLLSTGDACLVYESDDEWGGDENLFGFALMELRDEIRRLYKNEALIDWEYTEYLKHQYPYVNHRRDVNDEQSPEYRVMSSVLENSSMYVRDVNLKESLAAKYEPGQVIMERGFVDATDKIGAMTTTHRYAILSYQMADFSQFEKDTDWGIHVAKPKSTFKVLDIYEHEGKTQILLVHAPDGFESVFNLEADLIKKTVCDARESFRKALSGDVIEEVNTPEWLERLEFPLGMDDEGNFF